MLSHLTSRYSLEELENGKEITEREIGRLTELALGPSYQDCMDYVMKLHDQGAGTEDLLIHLLSPVAHRLGTLWETDDSDFVSVTLGLGYLQSIMRELVRGSRPATAVPSPGYRMLLSTVPGEQHTFGQLIVEEALRRAGWEVSGGMMATSPGELVTQVRSDWYAFVGLSMSDRRWTGDAKDCVAKIRDASLNRSVFIMVGGNAFLKDPSLVGEVGADRMATSGLDATRQAEKLLADSGFAEYLEASGK
jgi:methanogenic corrinoid protein MtbC1